MTKVLSITTDMVSPVLAPADYQYQYPHSPTCNFPAFDDTLAAMADAGSLQTPSHKLVDRTMQSPDRKASPLPSHISVPVKNGNGNGQRVLRSATIGYTAPEFKGKKAQMVQGWKPTVVVRFVGTD